MDFRGVEGLLSQALAHPASPPAGRNQETIPYSQENYEGYTHQRGLAIPRTSKDI